jgi:thioredoxin-related protein
MITRRILLIGAASLVATSAQRAQAEGPILTDDGLYKEPWFLESFLDLADDLEGARKEGKRFAVMWELKGCPYCKETHFVNFAQPRISDYVKTNFEVLQLNIIGSRRVTDFDGAELSDHPHVSVLRGGHTAAQEPAAGKARSRTGSRLSTARRFSRPVPLRA